VYTGQNPRQHVVLIEIQPNAYNNYLSQMAEVILTFFWDDFILYIWNSSILEPYFEGRAIKVIIDGDLTGTTVTSKLYYV
jgi:hypothetical protein